MYVFDAMLKGLAVALLCAAGRGDGPAVRAESDEAVEVRRPRVWEKIILSNFGGLVLGCIEADFCE